MSLQPHDEHLIPPETARVARAAFPKGTLYWLSVWVPPEWYERYGDRGENYALPKTEAERQKLAETIGAASTWWTRATRTPRHWSTARTTTA